MENHSDHNDTKIAIVVLKRMQGIMIDYPHKDLIVQLILLVMPYIISTLEETYSIQLRNQN